MHRFWREAVNRGLNTVLSQASLQALRRGSPGLQGVEVVVEGQPNGGLVLLPPPRLQPAGESRLTLVQAVDALLHQLEALLQHIQERRRLEPDGERLRGWQQGRRHGAQFTP